MRFVCIKNYDIYGTKCYFHSQARKIEICKNILLEFLLVVRLVEICYRICRIVIIIDNQMQIDTKGNGSEMITVGILIHGSFVRGFHGLKYNYLTSTIESSNLD